MTMPTSNPPHITLADLQACLPVDWHATLNELAASTLQATTPLKLSLVGAFSVGKSSLLNMLMNDPVLQASLEETTALPTFIEYGVQRAMQLVRKDGSVTPLDDETFATATTHAPEGAACAVLQQPLEWLRGVTIIDLPGTGSMSSTHRDFTLTQIQQSDAVLYLLNPTGPAAKDIELLTHIRQNAKQVKIVVTRWDVVEDAVAKGEKAPSLEAWAADIQKQAGLKRRLSAVSKAGLGREEIINFITRTRDDVAAIRQKRFLAEVRPLLENALGQNADLQRACEMQSEAEVAQLHAELLARRQTLMTLKTELYDQATADRAQAERQASELIANERSTLQSQLEQQAHAVEQEEKWNTFIVKGTHILREVLSKTAKNLSLQSTEYGQLNIPTGQVEALNLRIPPAESVSVEDFLDMGRIAQLQVNLETKECEAANKARDLAHLPTVDVRQHEEALSEVMQAHHAVASAELPVVQVPSEGGMGASLGRMLGEAADIGLMFLNPVTVGTKVASLIGKGAKVANIAIKTGKVAKHVTQGVKVAQQVKQGDPFAKLPPPMRDKLQTLEMLSLGYWGEKLGGMLGGNQPPKTMTDPAALEQQQRALADIDARRRYLQAELNRAQDIADERELTGWALEQNNKEQAQLRAELTAQQHKAEQKKQEFERLATTERAELLQRYTERAVEQWLRHFDQQTTGMTELLHGRVKDFWEQRVDGLVQERMVEVDAVAAQLSSAPAIKQAALAQLQSNAVALQTALKGVSA
jgi:GTP-binding protein EngB required for normal cell division